MSLVRKNYVFPTVYNPFFDNDWFFKWDSLIPEEKQTDVSIRPNTDISEDENKYSITIEIPGINKENLKITTENKYITIEANKNETKNEKTEKFTYKEIRKGSYKRSFLLPDTVDIDSENVAATYKDGVLNLELPKKQKKEKPKNLIPVKFE